MLHRLIKNIVLGVVLLVLLVACDNPVSVNEELPGIEIWTDPPIGGDDRNREYMPDSLANDKDWKGKRKKYPRIN